MMKSDLDECFNQDFKYSSRILSDPQLNTLCNIYYINDRKKCIFKSSGMAQDQIYHFVFCSSN
jgi:hypothetical protein